MGRTAVGLIIGLAYGAALGIYAYRWWAARQSTIDARFENIWRRDEEVARQLDILAKKMEASAV